MIMKRVHRFTSRWKDTVLVGPVCDEVENWEKRCRTAYEDENCVIRKMIEPGVMVGYVE